MPSESFPWPETGPRLERLAVDHELRFDPSRRAFVDPGTGLRFQPPHVLAVGEGIETPREYLAELPTELGLWVILLVQAGASALGLWHGDELLEHKAIKKYVVRGRGRAQPVHLATKGKSRYGSRLRLRNAVRQLAETNEKLATWKDEHGPFDQVYYACPVRTWPELFRQDPPPPFEREDARKIPLHVHKPDFAELRRVHRALTHGRLVQEDGDDRPGEG